MILITGAGGKTGRAVTRALHDSGAATRALLFRDEQVESARQSGASETIVGDMREAARMKSALDGIEQVYHVPPNMNPEEELMGQILVAAARSAGVKRIVYHSVFHPQVEEMPHHWRKMRVEARLFTCGLAFTILQPTAYMQNLLPQWDRVTESGRYEVPYSLDAKLSYVDLEDVARVAAQIILDESHVGATYELVGEASLSQREVASMLREVLGREILTEQLGIPTWRERARASGMGESQLEGFSRMFEYYDRYGLRGNAGVLAHLLGRAPTSMREFLEREHARRG
jgi:NAD(P)H dehydrogenase (quinone)